MTLANARGLFKGELFPQLHLIDNKLQIHQFHLNTELLIIYFSRFYALWRNRFHVWLKMEEGAQSVFKVRFNIS